MLFISAFTDTLITMVDYEFFTTWRLAAPLKLVWEAMYHSECWPEWWPGLLSVVELEKGDDSGIGNLRRYSWKGILPGWFSTSALLKSTDRSCWSAQPTAT